MVPYSQYGLSVFSVCGNCFCGVGSGVTCGKEVSRTGNNDFDRIVCLFDPCEGFVQLRSAALISEVSCVNKDVAWREGEGSAWAGVVRVGDADDAYSRG